MMTDDDGSPSQPISSAADLSSHQNYKVKNELM